MAEKIALEAEIREGTGKEAVKKMRNKGLIPAVIYGKGQENQNLVVNAKDLRVALKNSEAKLNSLFNLTIKNKDKSTEDLVLIHGYQIDPLKDYYVHLDFMKVNEKEPIHTKVSVKLVGIAPAVKAGFLLSQQLQDISISCLPLEIPTHIDIDVSGIEDAHDAIRVKDLNLEGVKIEMPDDQIIVHAEVPRTMKVAASAEGADGADGEAAEGEAPDAAEVPATKQGDDKAEEKSADDKKEG